MTHRMMGSRPLRLYAQLAATSLEQPPVLARLAQRGYAGVDMPWDEFGSSRGQLPFATVRDMLRAQGMGLIVRVPTRCGSSEPNAHVAHLARQLDEIADLFGDVVSRVVVHVSGSKWNVNAGVEFLRGAVPVAANFAAVHGHVSGVSFAASRTHWGTAEPITRALRELLEPLEASAHTLRDEMQNSTGETAASATSCRSQLLEQLRLSLDPAPWIGGPREQVEGLEYVAYADHLSLSPGWAEPPLSYWQVWQCRGMHTRHAGM